MTKHMVMENIRILMGLLMKDIGRPISKMDKDMKGGLMVVLTKGVM